jgi:hypothetical protein
MNFVGTAAAYAIHREASVNLLGINLGAWLSSLIANSSAVAAGVPVLDPGPAASALALTLVAALAWHLRKRST